MPHSGRVDLSSHTFSLNSEGQLELVPLHPSQIKVRAKSTSSVPAAAPKVEEEISPAAAQSSMSSPSMDTSTDASFSASAGANLPGMSTSLTGGSVDGMAAITVTSPQLRDDTDVGIEKRRKRKGLSLPGFGKRHSKDSKMSTLPVGKGGGKANLLAC